MNTRQKNRSRDKAFVVALLLVSGSSALAQSPLKGLEHLFTTPQSYTARFSASAPVIDGDLHDPAWETAAWSAPFVDIEGARREKPALETRMKLLWTDSCLYIAALLKEPQVWATLKKRDEVIFNDNDFEVFIDPDNDTHQYFEIEVNALNTIFDLFMPKPYRNGSDALIPFDTPGLRSAVKVFGTLNDPSDSDEGWTVEMAVPFRALTVGNDAHVPKEGETWRINFSRVEWESELNAGKYTRKWDNAGKRLPEHNWVWSPQGLVNMHYPERWGYLRFTKTADIQPFVLLYAEKQRQFLWMIYYREKNSYERQGAYVPAAGIPGLTRIVEIDGIPNTLTVEATRHQFRATISDGRGARLSINDEGLIRVNR